MKHLSIILTLLLCASTAWGRMGVLALGGGVPIGSASSFVGAPGATEGFEGPGITLTTELSETDPDGVIDCSSTTAAIDGTYGCLMSNGSSSAGINYIKADLGTAEESYSLTWKIKTPTTSGIFNNYMFFRSRLTDNPLGSATDDSSYVLFDNGNPNIILYNTSGGASDTSVNLSYNTVYKFTLKRTNNITGGLVLEIRNSSDTLVDTLTVDATNKSTRYFYWFDQQSGNDLYLDSIQYDSTNP